MVVADSSNYWLSSTALYISLNALGLPNYVQANCAGGSKFLCYMRNIVGLDYDNGHNYRSWNLLASPTYFTTDSKKYVYIAVPRSQAALDNTYGPGKYEAIEDQSTAMVVYPSEIIDIYGCNDKDQQIGSVYYFYINIQGVISKTENASARIWENGLVYGTLSTDEKNDLASKEFYDMFELELVTPEIPAETHIATETEAAELNAESGAVEGDSNFVIANETVIIDTPSVPAVYRIKAKYGLYSVGYLSAFGVDGGSTPTPSGSNVQWNQIYPSAGEKIATITIDGTKTDIYAPKGGGATTWNELLNKPSWISANVPDLGIFTNNAGYLTSVNWSDIIGHPTKLSEFENDLSLDGYVPYSGATHDLDLGYHKFKIGGVTLEDDGSGCLKISGAVYSTSFVSAFGKAAGSADAYEVVWNQIYDSGIPIATIKIGSANPITVYAPSTTPGGGGATTWLELSGRPTWLDAYISTPPPISLFTDDGTYVPFTGATKDVNLGAHALTAKSLIATTSLKIGNIILTDDNGVLKIDKPMYSTGYISAFGKSSDTASAYEVSWTQIETSGKKIATIKIGSASPISVYAPTGGSGATTWNELQNKPSWLTDNKPSVSSFSNDAGYITSASLTWSNITDKPSWIPATKPKVSFFENDKNYLTEVSWSDIKGTKPAVSFFTDDGTYVPFTGATKDVDLGAHTLTAKSLIATTSLKVGNITLTDDNGALKIDKPMYSTGYISAFGKNSDTASAYEVVWTQRQTSGTLIATIKIGSNSAIPVYAPTGGSGASSWTDLTGRPSWLDNYTENAPGVSFFSNDASYITSQALTWGNINNKPQWLTGGKPSVSAFDNDAGYLLPSDITALVPYSGATRDLDLGEHNLILGKNKRFYIKGADGTQHSIVTVAEGSTSSYYMFGESAYKKTNINTFLRGSSVCVQATTSDATNTPSVAKFSAVDYDLHLQYHKNLRIGNGVIAYNETKNLCEFSHIDGIRIGNAVLAWDATNQAVKLYNATNAATPLGMYATGGLTAFGVGVAGAAYTDMTLSGLLTLSSSTSKNNGGLLFKNGSYTANIYMKNAGLVFTNVYSLTGSTGASASIDNITAKDITTDNLIVNETLKLGDATLEWNAAKSTIKVQYLSGTTTITKYISLTNS